ncbi:MAG: hypothetical protein ACKPCM_18265, partial [Pseudanabaena sp.]
NSNKRDDAKHRLSYFVDIGNAPINLSIIKTWVLSVFRLHGFDSIKGSIERFSYNILAIWSLVT